MHTEVLTNNPQTYNCQDLSAQSSPGWTPPKSDNMFTVAFSGEIEPSVAIDAANSLYQKVTVTGDKYVCLGGGPVVWTIDNVDKIKDSINNDDFKAYQGICYDVEGYDDSDSSIKDKFKDCFDAARAKNLKNLVTTSHSGPYLKGDAADIMTFFFTSCDTIDIISPQMYTCDYGTANEYDFSKGVLWIPDGTTTVDFQTLYNNRANEELVILPSLFMNVDSPSNTYYDLYNTGGTNDGNFPIDFYNPLPEGFTVDKGAKNFFEEIVKIPISGSIQFANGTIKFTGTPPDCPNGPNCSG